MFTSSSMKQAAKKKEKEKEEFSWNKKKPDPKDFMFSNLKNQELTLVRRLFGDAVRTSSSQCPALSLRKPVNDDP